jgi:precorrin-6B methylase 1
MACMGTSKLAVLTDAKNTPQLLAQQILKKGLAPRQIVVLNNLTYPDEYLWRGKSEELATLEKELHNSVVVIYNE